jgi:hypothetical protein
MPAAFAAVAEQFDFSHRWFWWTMYLPFGNIPQVGVSVNANVEVPTRRWRGSTRFGKVPAKRRKRMRGEK